MSISTHETLYMSCSVSTGCSLLYSNSVQDNHDFIQNG